MTRKIKREGEAELHACMHMRQKKSRKGKKDKKEEKEWGWKRLLEDLGRTTGGDEKDLVATHPPPSLSALYERGRLSEKKRCVAIGRRRPHRV